MSRAETRAVFLVGFMGAGKTATGEALARRLGWRFIDLDALVEAREGRSIARIFTTDGEAAFRSAEATVLQEVLASLDQGTVVALGGGAFEDPRNARAIQEAGTVVFLEASPGVLWQRACKAATARPLMRTEADFVALHAQRMARYRQAAMTVNTEKKSVAEVAAEIATKLRITRER